MIKPDDPVCKEIAVDDEIQTGTGTYILLKAIRETWNQKLLTLLKSVDRTMAEA